VLSRRERAVGVLGLVGEEGTTIVTEARPSLVNKRIFA